MVGIGFKLPGLGAVPFGDIKLKSTNAEKVTPTPTKATVPVTEAVPVRSATSPSKDIKPAAEVSKPVEVAKQAVAKEESVRPSFLRQTSTTSPTKLESKPAAKAEPAVPEFLSFRSKLRSVGGNSNADNNAGAPEPKKLPSKTATDKGSNPNLLDRLVKLKPTGSKDHLSKDHLHKEEKKSSKDNLMDKLAHLKPGSNENLAAKKEEPQSTPASRFGLKSIPAGSTAATTTTVSSTSPVKELKPVASPAKTDTANVAEIEQEEPKKEESKKVVEEVKKVEPAKPVEEIKKEEPKRASVLDRISHLTAKKEEMPIKKHVFTGASSASISSTPVSPSSSAYNKEDSARKAVSSVSSPVSGTTTPSRRSFSSPTNTFNRFGSTAKMEPKAAATTYVQPKISGNINVSPVDNKFNVPLKDVKNDKFVSASGGAKRPKNPLLLIVKGKKKLAATKVPATVASLNHTDAFILDYGPPSTTKDDEKVPQRTLFVCTGEKASRVRRTKAIEMANVIKDMDYTGKADIVLLELHTLRDRTIPDKEMPFWQTILSKSPVTKSDIVEAAKSVPVTDGTDDIAFETQLNSRMKLYSFTQNSDGQCVVEDGKDLKHSSLNSQAVMVLDCGSELYVWAGKGATEPDRERATQFAEQRVRDSSDQPDLFFEGERFERTMFKSKFDDWPQGKEYSVYNVMEVKQIGNVKAKDKEWKVYDRGADAKKVDKLDIEKMYDKNQSMETNIVKNKEAMDIDPTELIRRDWGFSRLRIWAVYGYGGQKVVSLTEDVLKGMSRQFSEDKPFVFHSEECYIFMYEYKERPASMADDVLAERTAAKLTKEELISSMKDATVLYTWTGADSKVADSAVMAHVALKLDKWAREGKIDVKAKPRHVRVLEGKEPVHFLNMIKGGNIPRDQPPKILQMLPRAAVPPSPVILVRRGNQKSFANSQPHLYHVVGFHEDVVRIAEVRRPVASILTSAHSYAATDGKSNAFVWQGFGSFECERQASELLANNVLKHDGNSKVTVVKEGSEPEDFWRALNGKTAYDNSAVYKVRPSLPTLSPDSNIPLASSKNSSISAPYDTRLWRINFFVNGNPTASEISPFTPDDLQDDAVYILDTYFYCFVWIGFEVGRDRPTTPAPASSTPNTPTSAGSKSATSGLREIALAVETALRYCDYIDQREKGRLDRSKAFVVQSGKEPNTFTNQFLAWTDRTPAFDNWPSNISADKAWVMFESQKYSLADLKKFSQDRLNLPFGFDLDRLESFMTDEDFTKVFTMDREKFGALPKWRQTELKRKSGML